MVERVRADDPRLALYRGVGDPDLARTHGLFIAEGRLVVQRVLERAVGRRSAERRGRYMVRSVLLNEAAQLQLATLLAGLDDSVPILICETSDFARITGFNIHRGCLALVERPASIDIAGVIAGARRLVVLDGVTNADNVGGVFRNAAAFGVDGVVLSPDACDPLYRKAIRTSMAAVLRVPFARSRDWSGDLDRIRIAGLRLVALTPDDTAEAIDAFAARAAGWRLALAFGAEGSGVTSAVTSAADAAVRIPIRGGIDSLNVAVAAGIALHCLQPGTPVP